MARPGQAAPDALSPALVCELEQRAYELDPAWEGFVETKVLLDVSIGETEFIISTRLDLASMLPIYSINFVLLLATAVFFYRAGEFEGEGGYGFRWAGLSVLISLAIWGWLHWGAVALVLGQVGLFAGITFYRWRKKPP
jgi:hypothetical protein